MVTPEMVRDYIAAGLECTHLDVVGDGAHFEAVIVSTLFEGQSRINRQRLVNAALGERLGGEIHALSMKTLTPAEWEKQVQG